MKNLIAHKINLDNIPINRFSKIKWKLFNKMGIWKITDLIPYSLRDFYWSKIRTIFKPAHKRIRNSIPREWRDLDFVIENVNFEILKSFYEDEYKKDIVDWTTTTEHKEFAKWLEQAYNYVTIERPALQKKMDESYPDLSVNNILKPISKTSYKKLYGDVEKYEKLIETKDTELMIEIIKRRGWFWT